MSITSMSDGGVRVAAPKVGIPIHPRQQRQRMRVTGLTKSQAEDLLDWLEANGYRDRHISYLAGKGFSVSYCNGFEANP
ncbi:MAG TPA: hypothetical protein VGZ47_12380 [Gemmataceae bacterium]|jgi:hypothetical protein|nr:hypothetical protein [Gemmataceae bacterium]